MGYGVAANDFIPGEPIEKLCPNAELFIKNDQNLGYGRAINKLFLSLTDLPEYVGILNTDLTWSEGTFESILRFMDYSNDVVMCSPRIVDLAGNLQYLCKQYPTILGLMSRRYIPKNLKPPALFRYDRWYTMQDNDYNTIFDVPYLTGCCMVVRSEVFSLNSGFDERFFLYLEDADLTRSISQFGRCVHFSGASVVHTWGRGNYRSFRLAIVNIYSALLYFLKWGPRFW